MSLKYHPKEGDRGVILTRKGNCALTGFEVGDTVELIRLYNPDPNDDPYQTYYNIRNLTYRSSGSAGGYCQDEQIQWHIDVHDLVELRR